MNEHAALLLAGRRAAVRAQLFDKQRAVFDSRARWRAVLCSRRAGKTVLDSALCVDAALCSRFDEATVYFAAERSTAQRLIWPKLTAHVRQLGLTADPISWQINNADLHITTRAGAHIFVSGARGADHERTMDKIRGLKLRRVVLDEPATFGDVIERMFRDVLEPGLGDLRGDAIVTGTPGIVCAGWWHDVSTGAEKRAKWERHAWTVRENPHFRDPDGWLRETLADNGWAEDHPTYQREYLGRWFADDSDRVYRFVDERNGVDALPADYGEHWVHVLGVDFGTRADACAWAVIAAHPHRRESVTVEAFKRHGLQPDEAADVTRGLIERYRPDATAADSGGLGAPYVEEVRRRFGVQLTPAEKLGKRAHIELLNGELRAGTHALKKSACQDLREEIVLLPWASEAREREHPGYANDCADAWLYAYTRLRAYQHERPAPPKPTARRADDPEEIEAESARYLERESRPWWDR